MTAVITTPARHDTDQMSHSLLFQFIVVEFFNVHRQLQFLLPYIKDPVHCEIIKEVLFEQLPLLTHSLTVLAGASQGYNRTFSWNSEWGVLNKLNHYFFLFMRKRASEEEALIVLQNDLHQMLLAALQCRDFLRIVNRQGIDLPVTQYRTFVRNITHIQTGLAKLAGFIVNLLPEFRRDENLLFFLLRNRQAFEEFYHKEFLPNLIAAFFTNGLQECESYLHTRYSARAFPHLLPIISEKLSQMAGYEKHNNSKSH